MDNFANGPGIPMGFGMALTQSVGAMQRFAAMPPDTRNRIIEGARAIRTKPEMQAYVSGLID